jgi:UDP-glucuronate 4-epimerase
MKVLLTGAAGLIGMDLRPMLAKRGHEVVACDITAFGRTDPELRLMHLDERPRL